MKFCLRILEKMRHRLRNLNQSLQNLNKITRKRVGTARVRIRGKLVLRKFVQDHKLHRIVELSVTAAVHAGSQPPNPEAVAVVVAVFVE